MLRHYRYTYFFWLLVAILVTTLFLHIRFPGGETGNFILNYWFNLVGNFYLAFNLFGIFVLLPIVVSFILFSFLPKLSDKNASFVFRIMVSMIGILSLIIFVLSYLLNFPALSRLVFILTGVIFITISIGPIIFLLRKKPPTAFLKESLTPGIMICFGATLFLFASSAPFFSRMILDQISERHSLDEIKREFTFRKPSYIPSTIYGQREDLENNTIRTFYYCGPESLFIIRQTPLKRSQETLQTIRNQYNQMDRIYQISEISVGSFPGFYEDETNSVAPRNDLYFQTTDAFINIEDFPPLDGVSHTGCLSKQEAFKVAASMVIQGDPSYLLSSVIEKPFIYELLPTKSPTPSIIPVYDPRQPLIPISMPNPSDQAIKRSNTLLVSLNKTSYQQGELISFTIQNGYDDIFLYDCEFIPVEKNENGTTILYERKNKPGWIGEYTLSAKQSCTWGQKMIDQQGNTIVATSGMYRFRIDYFTNPNDVTTKHITYSPFFKIF